MSHTRIAQEVFEDALAAKIASSIIAEGDSNGIDHSMTLQQAKDYKRDHPSSSKPVGELVKETPDSGAGSKDYEEHWRERNDLNKKQMLDEDKEDGRFK
jgi:hypothetical protein